MATVFPFQAYRYHERAGRLEDLVTQPYDKISPEMQASYLRRSPFNLVRIILGERYPSDSAEDNVYTRAANLFRQWIDAGVFQRDPEPALSAYFQEFTEPDSGKRMVRKGFIGLGAVEEYSGGVVHRHEHTLSGPKQDRLELLRHTRAHFGQIFMLYPDPAGEIDVILDEISSGEPLAEVTDEYGAAHRLWRISQPAAIARIQELMAPKKLLIADGHHRYETALAFRREHPELDDARRVMMTFVNLHSPGLKILATHRLVSKADVGGFLEQGRRAFRMAAVPDLDALRRAWTEPHPALIRIGVAAAGEAGLHVLEAGRGNGELDVAFLHERILGDLLGIGEDAVRREENLRYVRGAEAAIEQVRSGAAAIAFLLEPTPMEDVARIAFSGGVLPQKSTDFYPKLLSGLAIYRLEK